MDSIEEIENKAMARARKVRVYATDEDIECRLHHYYQENINAMIKIGQRYDAVMDHYKEESGWMQRFQEAQERALAREKIVERVNPRSVHLSTEEMEKFRAEYPAPAQGLEINSVISLGFYSGKYHFQAGIIRPDLPEFQSDDCKTIPKLVRNVQKYMGKQQKRFHGAEIVPFFYTIEEENKFTTEQNESLIEYVTSIMPLSSFLVQKMRKLMDRPIRSLSAAEREEFERYYFWNV